nr:DUF3168 domain-containing protein [uncultured Cohaesibacter sp.]
MFEPVIALQAAMRSALVNSPDVLLLVDADSIRAGSTRPDTTPCIIMSGGTTELNGHDYRAQRNAWVNMDLHVWTFGKGQAMAHDIIGAIMHALDNQDLQVDGGYCDHFRTVTTHFIRDPDPDYGHAILKVEAFIRWMI